jgi:hypothetical protein
VQIVYYKKESYFIGGLYMPKRKMNKNKKAKSTDSAKKPQESCPIPDNEEEKSEELDTGTLASLMTMFFH